MIDTISLDSFYVETSEAICARMATGVTDNVGAYKARV